MFYRKAICFLLLFAVVAIIIISNAAFREFSLEQENRQLRQDSQLLWEAYISKDQIHDVNLVATYEGRGRLSKEEVISLCVPLAGEENLGMCDGNNFSSVPYDLVVYTSPVPFSCVNFSFSQTRDIHMVRGKTWVPPGKGQYSAGCVSSAIFFKDAGRDKS